MAKIMLVEDDNNLREIYEARLIAEGYEIVSAKDGEEALALAVKEKPDLIISDVMMPKISGFDMLDILRTTPETKNTKIIMMTALSQAEDKARADKLGADRYLVKSQVTLEDVAAVAREVLTGETAATPSTGVSAPATVISEDPVPVATPLVDTPTPDDTSTATPDPTPAVSVAPATNDDAATANVSQTSDTPPVVDTPTSVLPDAVDPSLGQTVEEDKQLIEEQINTFVANVPSTEPPEEPKPEPVAPPAPPSPAEEPLAHIEVAAPPTDSTNAAADNAAMLADAVNDMLQKPAEPGVQTAPETPTSSTEAQPEPVNPEPITTESGMPAKKVIQPLNDLNTSAPDLNALLQQEELKEAALNNPSPETPAAPSEPVSNIAINENGEINTPPVAEASTPAAPDTTDPNNPNNIAL